MRFTPSALFLAVLVAFSAPLPVMAQGLVVSSFGCRQSLPCDGNDLHFPSTDKLIADTNACVARYLPTMPDVPVFDEVAGLDSNGCLTTNPAAFPTKGTSLAIPHCCVQQNTTGTCAIHCDVISE